MNPMINTLIAGRFRVEEHLAQSANGEVFRALDTSSNQEVALKVLRPRFLVGKKFGARLRLEFRVLQGMDHPNIVRVLECGETDDNLHYFAMEFVPGQTLQQIITQQGALPPARVANYLDQIASALDYAHGQQIVHRDINPHNVVVQTDFEGNETVKLLDFGLAKVLDTEQMKTSMPATGAAMIVGNVYYMSPEQAMGKPVDKEADIYSLGATLFALLTGKPVFEEESEIDTMVSQAEKNPPSFSQRNPAIRVNSHIEAIVMQALSKRPSDRQRSAGELASGFRRALGMTGESVKPQKNARTGRATRTGEVRAKSGLPEKESSDRSGVRTAIALILFGILITLVLILSAL